MFKLSSTQHWGESSAGNWTLRIKDTLTGGTGSDRFTFNSRTEGIDRITDFRVVDLLGEDDCDLKFWQCQNYHNGNLHRDVYLHKIYI
ncbi:MAG: proprotein convertase P-domain-containing protein [Nostoc sp. CreGUA01]|nr:proprotein convertase P-domain-containing protein [Nostoc sp. CreGUA01]